MRLLVVTDHRYYGTPDGVYDNTCLDRRFFDDYCSVFDEVVVAARIRSDAAPAAARRSDGEGVTFVPLPDVRGPRYMLLAGKLVGPALRQAIAASDAVCVRIPALSGNVAASLARAQGKPVMFELIGDPLANLVAGKGGLAVRVAGRLQADQTRSITRAAVAGSYVSRSHLQAGYPAGANTVTDSISSIRLPASDLRPAKDYDALPAPMVITLTASFVPVKRHDTLIRAVADALGRGADTRLELIGDGALRPAMEQLSVELGVADRTVFHGHVSDRGQLVALLDRSDLFAMTSASEGMPRSMIEAMARGIAGVGTRAGGIAELLTDQQLVPVGDHEALGQLLAELAASPETLNRLARHSETMAREFVEDELSRRRRGLLGVLRQHAERRHSGA